MDHHFGRLQVERRVQEGRLHKAWLALSRQQQSGLRSLLPIRLTEGWASEESIGKEHYFDNVACRNFDCLKNGWTVRTGYDFFGGNVVCNLNDCSKFGGESLWRGRPARTQCYANDCYKNGWTLTVY